MSTEDLTNLKGKNSIVCIETKQIALFGSGGSGSGSGFFVKPDIIVTNIHVITDRGSILVKSSDRKTSWKVKGVTAFDVRNDLVAIKVRGEGTPLPLGDSSYLQNGDPISVVGFPHGEYKVTEGVVYSHRDSDKQIRMKADLYHGNSGSPVLNEERKAIGIVNHVSKFYYSWAIPSNVIKALLDRLEPAESLVKWRTRKIIRSFTKFSQGKRHLWEGRYRKAIADFDKAIKLNPKLIDAYGDRGFAKSESGDQYGAIADFDKVISLKPMDDSAYTNRGVAKAKLGDVEDAITDFDKVIELDPMDAKAYNNRGTTMKKLGDFEDAITDFDKAIKLNPKDADLYNNRGFVKFDLGNYEDAITDFDKAVRLQPEYSSYYNNRGLVKSWHGDVEEAIVDYDKAIELNPKDAVAYRNRAWAKHLLGKSNAVAGNTVSAQALYHTAISDSNEAIELDPENAIFYHTRGVVKAAMGDSIDSIEDFDIAIQLDPEYAKAYFDRALAKEALGQQDAAKADSDKAKELDPDIEKDSK